MRQAALKDDGPGRLEERSLPPTSIPCTDTDTSAKMIPPRVSASPEVSYLGMYMTFKQISPSELEKLQIAAIRDRNCEKESAA